MKISHLGGWRFNVRCRGHQIVSDQPLEEDGEDTGMTPVELFVSSLGCCIGVYAKMFCERHKIPYEGMKIDLEWKMARNPSRVSEFKATIRLEKDVDPDLAQGILRMVKHCTVHNTVRDPPEIEISVSSSSALVKD
jgi:uncharacterized OsmC-like protein